MVPCLISFCRSFNLFASNWNLRIITSLVSPLVVDMYLFKYPHMAISIIVNNTYNFQIWPAFLDADIFPEKKVVVSSPHIPSEQDFLLSPLSGQTVQLTLRSTYHQPCDFLRVYRKKIKSVGHFLALLTSVPPWISLVLSSWPTSWRQVVKSVLCSVLPFGHVFTNIFMDSTMVNLLRRYLATLNIYIFFCFVLFCFFFSSRNCAQLLKKCSLLRPVLKGLAPEFLCPIFFAATRLWDDNDFVIFMAISNTSQ